MNALIRKDNIVDAFSSGRCPICFLLQQDEFAYLCHWVGVSDEKDRASEERVRLLKSKGFCNYHFWEFNRISGYYGSAEIGMTIIEKVIALFKNEGREALLADLLKHYHELDCPLCADMKEKEIGYIKELISLFESNENRSKYATGLGLCIPHLIKTVIKAKDDSLAFFLFEAQKEGMEMVKLHAKEFIRKRHPPLSWEQTKDEENSGVRAIEKLVGRPGQKIC